jgi:hypothetical protein
MKIMKAPNRSTPDALLPVAECTFGKARLVCSPEKSAIGDANLQPER